MGEVASKGADVVIVTTDNPRGEDPHSISSAIIAGASSGAEVREEPDRRRAIKQAIEIAGPDDVVLLAGKGHESTQIIGLVEAPFDDRVVAREILAERNTAC
jgi:UDP-N-acetylmuramoyl-L-alanyl-D-glutamate--2,6-diaminopimelate ligase